MEPIKFISPFLLAVCFLLIAPPFFPQLHLTFLAPPLIITLYRRRLIPSLWAGLLVGFLIDLMGQGKIGFYATSYLLTLWAISPLKTFFFPDRLSTLPLLTWCFGALSTLIQFFLLKFLGHGFGWSFSWIFTDLLVMPFADALYAFLFFTLPGFLPRRSNREYFSRYGYATGRSPRSSF